MITEKLEEMVRRQSALTKKMIDETASDEEKAELKKLTDAIAEATTEKPATVTSKTTLATMTLGEFQEKTDALMKGDPSKEQLALIKRNLEAIKNQGVTEADGVVAVEVMVEFSAEERIADLEAKVKAMEEGFDGRTQTGLVVPSDEDDDKGDDKGDDVDKGDKPAAQALAMEVIDTLLASYTKVKAAIESGSFTKDDLKLMYDDWDLKRVIESSAAIMAKMDELKIAVEAVLPGLEKLAEKDVEDDKDGKGDGVDKGGDFAWPTGDLSKSETNSDKQYQDLKKASGHVRDQG